METLHPSSGYRTQPVHVFSCLTIQQGHATLAQKLAALLATKTRPATVVIDGFVGIQWDAFITQLCSEFARYDIAIQWLTTDVCLLPAEQIKTLIASSLTGDPVFGRHMHEHLEELWDQGQVALLRQQIQGTTQHTILSGFGASLITEGDICVYADVPKDRGQFLAGRKQVYNVGADTHEAFSLMYKRLYFVDWPMLNRIKRAMLPRLDVFVDATESADPLWVDGASFREALHALASQPFRVKPWFAPGPWGGQWMKKQFRLPPEAPNYAWSFELIAPENGILLGDGTHNLECSFDYLLWWETEAVLGISVAARYGSYFPIRFDYLDTMGGTNLSCQVHPRMDYMRDEFGEPLTQDETYYIVTCEAHACVFLGLREDTDLEAFKSAALTARDRRVPFEISDYVNSFPSRPHDLFLIPSGTVHCSGANNLVLEISATPYIFTFKIYDYLRDDLSGNLRHVHLDHAFANIDATRTTDWVRQHLVPQPVLLRAGADWAEYCIGDSERLFFAIHRLEFSTSIEDRTQGKFVALNLVEGERCEVLTGNGGVVELRFAESMVIPASVEHYVLRNRGSAPCKVVKAFVKA